MSYFGASDIASNRRQLSEAISTNDLHLVCVWVILDSVVTHPFANAWNPASKEGRLLPPKRRPLGHHSGTTPQQATTAVLHRAQLNGRIWRVPTV